MEYASDADMATCLSSWSTYTLLAASTAPGYETDDTGAPEIPIRLSSAGDSVMFATKQMMWEVGGWMSLAGFVASFLFTLIHLSIGVTAHGFSA